MIDSGVAHATCHPDRKVWCRGMCQPCYTARRKWERYSEADWITRGVWFCRRCVGEKPVSDFYLSRGRPRNFCKSCDKRRISDRQKFRYSTDEIYRSYVRLLTNAWDKTNSSRHHLRTRYGLSLGDYDALLERQGGVCPICLQPPAERRLVVDHDHSTGRVRGLLHVQCNSGIGQLGDDPETLLRAAEYLVGTNAKQRA